MQSVGGREDHFHMIIRAIAAKALQGIAAEHHALDARGDPFNPLHGHLPKLYREGP